VETKTHPSFDVNPATVTQSVDNHLTNNYLNLVKADAHIFKSSYSVLNCN
jgi:hypothetical protein